MNCELENAYNLKFGLPYKRPKKTMRKLILIFAGILLFSVQTKAQLDEIDTGSIIKASYIYNFAKLIEWTETKSTPELKIDILGDVNLYKQLVKRYAGKKIGNQTVEVKLIMEISDAQGIHILFVSRKHANLLSDISKKLQGKNTLLITEMDGALTKGSTINFIAVNNNLKFEINETNATAHNLIIGSTLKSLAENK